MLAAAGALYWGYASRQPAPGTAPAPAVLVSTLRLTPGQLPAAVTAYGSVTAGPAGQTAISLPAGGIVTSVAVIPGQRVAAGAMLVTMAADAQSVADLRKAVDALAAAKAGRAHVEALLAGRLATSADLAAADQAVNDAAAALIALQATGTGQARSITAPFAGIITAISAVPGTVQPAGAMLMQLADESHLAAMAGVPPVQAAAIAAGDAAQITLLDTGAVLNAAVTQVSVMPDPQSGLDEVTLQPRGLVPLGAPLMTVITTGKLSGYVVPRDAVQNDDQGNYVFQVDAAGIAHRETVQVLGSSGTQTVLAPTLDAAMPLVTTGAYQLDDGMAVRMNTSSGAVN